MAAEQHRLVLVHFFNDNCGPCVRVDQNVFSQAEVAEAVAQNYVAVKVHAGKNPQLATRYRVNQWPTDVFVTPSGLEVYRTVSPKEPAEYIGLLSQVAGPETGIGAAQQVEEPACLRRRTARSRTLKTLQPNSAAVGRGGQSISSSGR